MSKQPRELDFTPGFLRGHPLSFKVAEKLAGLLPKGIDRMFFANSGSEAVDSAMKICLVYHRARGERTPAMFVSRERAYHGVDFGGIALSGMVNNRRVYGNMLASVAHMRHTWLPENRFAKGLPDRGAELAEGLQRMVNLFGAENIAACVVEPIAGSTGVLALEPGGKRYTLGPRLSRLGLNVLMNSSLRGSRRAILQRLVDELGETCYAPRSTQVK